MFISIAADVRQCVGQLRIFHQSYITPSDGVIYVTCRCLREITPLLSVSGEVST